VAGRVQVRFRPLLNILGNIPSPFTRDVLRQSGAVLKVVPTPPLRSSWADAVIAAIDGSVAVVAVPHVHWCDGSLVDLEVLALRTPLLPTPSFTKPPTALVCRPLHATWTPAPAATGRCWWWTRRSPSEPCRSTWPRCARRSSARPRTSGCAGRTASPSVRPFPPWLPIASLHIPSQPPND
jgi:hypothetical protein